MKLQLRKYTEHVKEWPKEGYHIMAQYDNEKIIVYQSYRPAIGNFAAENQFFGGPFSLDRMTWIKPNFLWMMYRNGWGTKTGQEVVLAIHLKREAFERYVRGAVHSSYYEDLYESHDAWKEQLTHSSVRLQWDPDHDPYGKKLPRRAIQIGVRGEETKRYSKEDILAIEDVSEFVREQRTFVEKRDLDQLWVPEEKPLLFEDDALNKKLYLK